MGRGEDLTFLSSVRVTGRVVSSDDVLKLVFWMIEVWWVQALHMSLS